MKKKRLVLILAISCVTLVMSCQMPAVLSDAGSPSSAAQETPLPLSIITVAARNQAVYVNEKGVKNDIKNVEPDGSVVACVQASSIVDTRGDNDAGGTKALITGTRSDGNPGIWVVYVDDTIHALLNESTRGATSKLPESDDHDKSFHRDFGWKYIVTATSADGKMVVGYAKNEKGSSTVLPGTTVGIYWRIVRVDAHHHPFITRARIIGVLDATKHSRKHGLGRNRILASLQLFLQGYFSDYLVMTDGVSFDPGKNLYNVSGTDQDDVSAVAAIDGKNVITITEVSTGQSELTVSSIQVPGAAVRKTASWTLGATVTNGGSASSDTSTLTYQLSAKGTLDSTATTIGTSSIPAIAAGQSYSDTFSTTYTIAQSGTYWIFATVGSKTTSASVAVIYDRLYIDTVAPNASVGSMPATFISLFGPNGDATPNDPNEYGTAPSYSVDGSIAIAEADGAGSYAALDYTDGLAPGTYYVRIRGETSTQVGPLVARFVTLNMGDARPAAGTLPTLTSDPYPAFGGYVPGTGVPSNPLLVTLGAPPTELDFNRYLNASDMDWFKLVLP